MDEVARLSREVSDAGHRIALLEDRVHELRGEVQSQARWAAHQRRKLDAFELISAGWFMGALQLGAALLFFIGAVSGRFESPAASVGAVAFLLAGAFTILWSGFIAWER